MSTHRFLLVIVGIFSFLAVSSAQGNKTEKEYIEKRYTIFYRVNKSDIDRDYMNNGHTIHTMIEDVRNTLRNQGTIPDSLIVFASTSPEGSVAVNERLAIERAESTKEILLKNCPQFGQSKIRVESRANDWSGLILVLRRNNSLVYRHDILKVLTDPTISNKQAALMRMPEAYEEVKDELFSNMRTASITIRVIRTATNVDEFVTEPELYLTTKSPVTFTVEGGEGKLEYKKNVEEDGVVPAVRTEAKWIKDIMPTTTGAKFAVEPNPIAQKRSAAVSVECYGKTQEIIVEQEAAAPIYNVTSQKQMSFPAEGGSDVITAETNAPEGTVPVVTCSEDWVTTTVAEDGSINVTVAGNEAHKTRSAAITVECLGKTEQMVVTQEGVEKEQKPFYMAAKTNMLYDLGIVPNVGVEFYLGKNFSVVGNWMYSWWKSDKAAWYWRTYGGDLAVRYWFGKKAQEKPLQGHHVGLYGQIVTYDFEVGGRGYLGDRWSWGAGAEYGYSLPVAKRLNIDFNLGVGYLGGEFKEYLPIDGHYVWQVTKHRHWFGPTKAEISLTWLLGRGNDNEGKGGKR
jgi:hypothetical protein